MKKSHITFLIAFGLIFFAFLTNAQTRTITGSGNWSTSTNWLGGNIGGAIDNDDDVMMNDNIDITILAAEFYTVATLSVSKDGSLTIDVGGTLIVTGDLSVEKDFTINVDGDLTIQGNMVVAKSLQLNVTGNLSIFGNVDVAKDAQMDVQGAMSVSGNFTSAKDAQINVDGTLDVTGDLNLGTGSVIIGVGVVVTGSCSGAACGDSQLLPIELIYFSASEKENVVQLSWATAMEENFDYFSLERSQDGENFIEIAQVEGHGDSYQRNDYKFVDKFPLNGNSYYRLRSVDFDGFTEIFDYVMVNIELVANDFSVCPNPVENGQLTIQTNFQTKSGTELIVYNSMGTAKRRYHLDSWMTKIDLEGIEPGSYLIKLVSGDNIIIKRILVNN